MAKKKMIQANLVKNSTAAYFAAIEIHNKPNIPYRYETTTLLMMNAWELVLKAYVRKYIKGKSIFEDNGHTIQFKTALAYVAEHINAQKPKSFTAIKENLEAIEAYRNNIVHFYNEQLEPYIFMLVAKAATNYVDFLKKYFTKDIMADEGLFILPLGFKLPFLPQDFLSKKAAAKLDSPEAKAFMDLIIKKTQSLQERGIEDSIVVGFNIYLESLKTATNSDIIAAITTADQADTTIAQVRRVQIVNDKGAAKVQLSDIDILAQYPLSHQELISKCRERIPGFKANPEFYKILAPLRQNTTLAFGRSNNPKSKKPQKTFFYREPIVEEIRKAWVAKFGEVSEDSSSAQAD